MLTRSLLWYAKLFYQTHKQMVSLFSKTNFCRFISSQWFVAINNGSHSETKATESLIWMNSNTNYLFGWNNAKEFVGLKHRNTERKTKNNEYLKLNAFVLPLILINSSYVHERIRSQKVCDKFSFITNGSNAGIWNNV